MAEKMTAGEYEAYLYRTGSSVYGVWCVVSVAVVGRLRSVYCVWCVECGECEGNREECVWCVVYGEQ